MRQYIQWLDKVLRKPRSLRRMDLDSYRARTFLGECLWDLFASRHLADAGEAINGVPLRDLWRAKVHPYAEADVKWLFPDWDENAKKIKEYVAQRPAYRRNEGVSRTRWVDVFGVPFGARELERYRKAAEKIQDHLLSREMKINGQRRTRRKIPVADGFIRERGNAIVQSASDPRVRRERTKVAWGKEEEALYQRPEDVAAKIREALICGPRRERPSKIVGSLLYAHFGAIGTDKKTFKPPQKLWNLHNAVRLHYKRLLETRRFMEAVRSEDHVKLSHLLPADLDQLFARLKGASNGQELQRRIRVGKLLAHAVELCFVESNTRDDKFDAMVKDAMDYFATSIGQADIKRNEAFVRVLRTSVALAQRTMHAWLQPGYSAALALAEKTRNKNDIATLSDHDVATTAVGALAVIPCATRRSGASA